RGRKQYPAGLEEPCELAHPFKVHFLVQVRENRIRVDHIVGSVCQRRGWARRTDVESPEPEELSAESYYVGIDVHTVDVAGVEVVEEKAHHPAPSTAEGDERVVGGQRMGQRSG